jgi:N-acylneuraminate cytidylyltransferase
MHSVDMAREIFNDNEICISTDSTKIKAVVEKSGLHVPFLRPEELAQDTSSTEDVLMHTLSWYNHNGYEPDMIILLQPTSPFRQLKDINKAIAKFSKEIDMVVSVKQGKANPYFNLYEENDSGFLEKSKKGTFDRYQDSPEVWEFNGSIYIINVANLKSKGFSNFNKIIKYTIENPIYSLDIDTEFDWLIAKTIIGEER